MRIVLVVLMLALLPLRLWAAEGMAMRMAQEQLGASAATSMPADCPMMAKAGAVQDMQDEAPQASGQCASCHLCSASVCPTPQAVPPGAAPAAAASGSARYASADQPPDLRPPIA